MPPPGSERAQAQQQRRPEPPGPPGRGAAAEERALLAALEGGASIQIGERGIELPTLADFLRFCTWVHLSGLAPRGVDSVAKVFMVLQKGREAGLSAMQSLASVDIIEGVPAWKVKAAMGMVRASGKLAGYRREWRGKPFEEDFCAWVWGRRADTGEEMESSYSVADAKLARLWGKTSREGKPSPWVLHPKRQLYARAQGFLLQDLWGDVIGQWDTAEAVRDWAGADDMDVAAAVRAADERAGAGPRFVAPPPASPVLQALAAGEAPISFELPRARERELVERSPAHASTAPQQLTLDVAPATGGTLPPQPAQLVGEAVRSEPAEPFTGVLAPELAQAILRRVASLNLLDEHAGRAADELEELVRLQVGAGRAPAEIQTAVHSWRPKWG